MHSKRSLFVSSTAGFLKREHCGKTTSAVLVLKGHGQEIITYFNREHQNCRRLSSEQGKWKKSRERDAQKKRENGQKNRAWKSSTQTEQDCEVCTDPLYEPLALWYEGKVSRDQSFSHMYLTTLCLYGDNLTPIFDCCTHSHHCTTYLAQHTRSHLMSMCLKLFRHLYSH